MNIQRGPSNPGGTTTRDYRLMNEEEQSLVILEARRTLFHQYVDEREVPRADCVARLFDVETVEGQQQMATLKKQIDSQDDFDEKLFVEEMTIDFINVNYCLKN